MSTAPAEARPDLDRELDDLVAAQTPWVVLVWNDPVNLMSYVTFVFQEYFGYPREKAESLMLDVHEKGRAAVAHGTRDECERHTEALHGYGLWATFQKDS